MFLRPDIAAAVTSARAVPVCGDFPRLSTRLSTPEDSWFLIDRSFLVLINLNIFVFSISAAAQTSSLRDVRSLDPESPLAEAAHFRHVYSCPPPLDA